MADEHHHQDPTFYRTPRDAAEAPPEKLAYVVAFDRSSQRPDALTVLREAAEARTLPMDALRMAAFIVSSLAIHENDPLFAVGA